jgi:hypothetical protein
MRGLWTGRGIALLVLLSFTTALAGAQGPQTVQVSLPLSIAFAVSDVTVSTPATGVTAIAFANAALNNNRGLRIRVRALGNFVPPAGQAVAADHVSWVTSNATNGTGVSGTLSRTAFRDVFQADANAPSGGVDLAWTLGPIGSPVRAGAHQLTLRWRLESVMP